MSRKRMFYNCTLCGKKLIERMPNGLLRFIFGKNEEYTPVEIMVHGSVRMRCWRRECRGGAPDHWNTISFLPNIVESKENIISNAETGNNEDTNKEGR